jgi:uncharacterized protein (DUF1330 family)
MRKYLATSALMAVSLLLGAGGATIYAQSNVPIYAVAEINVKDKDGYDKVLPMALDLIKAGGGKYIAGGYNKSKSIMGAPPPNRYVLIRYDGGAEAFDKVWNGGLKDWVEKEGSKYADFRLFNVESAEMK